MAQKVQKATYFTKHLFKTGLKCLTKLYYKSQDYPEDQESQPFIEHAIYNKKLLKSLARSIYSDGQFVRGNSIDEAAVLTRDLLSEENIILFDAVFAYQQMMAKLPIVIKRGRQLTAIHVQTKAFSSRKHRLWNHKGEIHSRWKRYLLDFSYQLFLLKQQYPDFSVLPLLILPDKSGYAQTNGLPAMLKPFDRYHVASKVPASNQQLLVKLDVSKPISEIHHSTDFAEKNLPSSTFEESLQYLRNIYLQQKKVEPELGNKCKNCEFRISDRQKKEFGNSGFDECWEDQKQTANGQARHVFNLIGPGTQKLVEEAVFYQQNVDDSNLPSVGEIVQRNGKISEKMRQSLQVHQSKGTEVPAEIMRPPLCKELRRWRYPLHFLDFEAGNYAVPIRRGRPPYHLIVFQFSCHTLHQDGSWKHHQWIDDFSSEYPNYELVRRLMKVPNINDGTIVQYSNFERNALKIIRRELQEEAEVIPDSKWLIQWIEEIIQRNDSSHSQPPYVADMSRQVRHFYYNKEMGSSLSIKDVLQSVMNQSAYLKEKYSQPYSSSNFDDIIWWQSENGKAQSPYDILQKSGNSTVGRGTEAMVLYGKLIADNMTKKEQDARRASLLRYCELDTLAMLMIYQHWKHKMNELY